MTFKTQKRKHHFKGMSMIFVSTHFSITTTMNVPGSLTLQKYVIVNTEYTHNFAVFSARDVFVSETFCFLVCWSLDLVSAVMIVPVTHSVVIGT